jgi:hypothetical protein
MATASGTLAIAYVTYLEARRQHTVWLALGWTAFCVGVGLFFQQLAIAEAGATYTAITAALLRSGAAVVVCLFVVSSVIRETEQGGLPWLMAMPLPRYAYPLGKILGTVPLIGLLLGLGSLSVLPFAAAFDLFQWAVTLACELLLVAAFSLLCALGLRQLPLAVAATLGFYGLARSMDAIVLMAAQPAVTETGYASALVGQAAGLLATLLPALPRYADTAWLIYGGEAVSLSAVVVQTAIYLVLLLAATVFDFYRREL